jgi:hypothetical protein
MDKNRRCGPVILFAMKDLLVDNLTISYAV